MCRFALNRSNGINYVREYNCDVYSADNRHLLNNIQKYTVDNLYMVRKPLKILFDTWFPEKTSIVRRKHMYFGTLDKSKIIKCYSAGATFYNLNIFVRNLYNLNDKKYITNCIYKLRWIYSEVYYSLSSRDQWEHITYIT